MPMTLKEMIANIDPRLRGQTIRFTGDGVLVMVDGNWHALDHDFSVRIELAPQFGGYDNCRIQEMPAAQAVDMGPVGRRFG